MADKSEHGRHHRAGRTVTRDDVRAIRAAHTTGQTIETLATAYGLHFSTVHRIVTRRSWRTVS